jgi:uncharacterized protein (TIGR02284 family)
MTSHTDTLTSLHTALIDSRNGYEEALKDAEGKGLTPLFREMIALRRQHADELKHHLIGMGAEVDDEGSFMSAVHRTVISLRSVFTELDEGILPGLIDGEERIVGYYDEAIESVLPGSRENAALVAQRTVLKAKIADMQMRKAVAAE